MPPHYIYLRTAATSSSERHRERTDGKKKQKERKKANGERVRSQRDTEKQTRIATKVEKQQQNKLNECHTPFSHSLLFVTVFHPNPDTPALLSTQQCCIVCAHRHTNVATICRLGSKPHTPFQITQAERRSLISPPGWLSVWHRLLWKLIHRRLTHFMFTILRQADTYTCTHTDTHSS